MEHETKESWLKRYFGKERNPERLRLARKASALISIGTLCAMLVRYLLGGQGVAVPLLILGAGFWVAGVVYVGKALREPHQG